MIFIKERKTAPAGWCVIGDNNPEFTEISVVNLLGGKEDLLHSP
jgi:hypothetical protein